MERIENEKKEKLEQISEEKDLQNKLKQQMLKD